MKYISGHAHKIVFWYLLVILFKMSFFNVGFSPLNTEDYTFSILQSDQWSLSVLPKVRFLNNRCTPLKNVRSEPFILRTKVRFTLLNGIPVPLQSSDPVFTLLAVGNTDERKYI